MSSALNIVMLLANDGSNDSRVQKEALALAEAGHRVTVLCRSKDPNLKDFDIRGVHYRRIVKSTASTALHADGPRSNFGLLLKKFLAKLKGPAAPIEPQAAKPGKDFKRIRSLFVQPAIDLCPEIVVAHDLATLPAGVEIATRTGAKLIYDSHELEMHSKSMAALPADEQEHRKFVEARDIVLCHAVMTVSDRIADHLAQVYPISRPTVIANGPEGRLNSGEPSTGGLREYLGLNKETPLVVYAGMMTTHRGVEKVVQALPLLPGVHFATVGPRREAVEAEALRIVAENGCADRFHLVDAVPPSEVVEFIRSANASVIPIQNVCLSYDYCLPNKLFESVLAGIPIAASNLSELSSFIERYPIGVLMDEISPSDIARAISELLSAPMRFKASPEVIESILERYGWETQRKRLIALFEDLN